MHKASSWSLLSFMLDCDHIFTLHDETGRELGSIYQGSMPDPAELGSFDALVLCAFENQNADDYAPLHVIEAPGDDVRDWPIDQFDLEQWIRASHAVAELVRSGMEVLVTCMAGLNRSGMVSAMALHHLTGWDGEKCVGWVQGRRCSALFNPAFKRWLEENLHAVE